jgi:protocatechuate 3,4-dioxygenase beta subunit
VRGRRRPHAFRDRRAVLQAALARARRALEKGIPGTPLELSGRVFGRDCKPLAGALLDFWQADGEGEYDNEGFRLRGHQYTGADGRFRLSTVVPGLYPGRTRHIHVRVQPKGGRVLTTQLYVPGRAEQRRIPCSERAADGARRLDEPAHGRFNFVLDAS